MAVGATENNAWDAETKSYTDKVENVSVDVVAKNTRYKTFSVKVPPDGYTLGLDDDDFETIAESDNSFPAVAFDGLSIEMFTRKDSRVITYSGKANAVYLCDENGKPLK
jgi:hypothetical protein